MKTFYLISLISLLISCQEKTNKSSKTESEKTKVLNLGIFHMGETMDEHSTNYDELEKKNKADINEVCRLISQFKPTLIFVETDPRNNNKLNQAYLQYLKNSTLATTYSKNEIQLLGFEIGKLSNTKKILGFDHRLGYNYDLSEVAKNENCTDYFEIEKQLEKEDKKHPLKASLKETYLDINTQKYYDLLINFNADLLLYANSKDGFEGADEASKFYQRNLRMFANINKIKTKKTDRILIIAGATHSAFLNDFMRRSPKYQVENLSDYLK